LARGRGVEGTPEKGLPSDHRVKWRRVYRDKRKTRLGETLGLREKKGLNGPVKNFTQVLSREPGIRIRIRGQLKTARGEGGRKKGRDRRQLGARSLQNDVKKKLVSVARLKRGKGRACPFSLRASPAA